jgi:hypothetical protein
MELKKGQNIIEHEAEIYARPARTWFQSEKEKQNAKGKLISSFCLDVKLNEQTQVNQHTYLPSPKKRNHSIRNPNPMKKKNQPSKEGNTMVYPVNSNDEKWQWKKTRQMNKFQRIQQLLFEMPKSPHSQSRLLRLYPRNYRLKVKERIRRRRLLEDVLEVGRVVRLIPPVESERECGLRRQRSILTRRVVKRGPREARGLGSRVLLASVRFHHCCTMHHVLIAVDHFALVDGIQQGCIQQEDKTPRNPYSPPSVLGLSTIVASKLKRHIPFLTILESLRTAATCFSNIST